MDVWRFVLMLAALLPLAARGSTDEAANLEPNLPSLLPGSELSSEPETQFPLRRSQGQRPVAPSQAEEGEDLTALGNKQINPVSDLWSLVVQHDTALFRGGRSYRGVSDLKFQPVLPLDLTSGLRLVARPVFPLVVNRPESTPRMDGSLSLKRQTAFGDIGMVTLLAPAKKESQGSFWGLGATWLFPTASNDDLGCECYGAGLAGVYFNFAEPWIFGVFPQHIWDIGGRSDRKDVRVTNTQLFLLRTLPGTNWKVGMTPNILIDWEADGGNAWQVPLGIGATTVKKIGGINTRFLFEVQYYVAHPNDFGPRWNFRILIAPVIQKPQRFRAPLFD